MDGDILEAPRSVSVRVSVRCSCMLDVGKTHFLREKLMFMIQKSLSSARLGAAILAAIAFAVNLNDVNAAAIVGPQVHNPSVSGGAQVPNPNNTPDGTQAAGFANGFDVSGGFSVEAAASTVTISFDTTDKLFAGPEGQYALVMGLFSYFYDSMGKTDIGVTFAGEGVLTNSSNQTLADINLTLGQNFLTGVTTDQGPNGNGALALGGFTVSTPFFLTALEPVNLSLETTITFTNVPTNDIVTFDLPNGMNFSPVPEPSTFALLGLGGAGLAIGAFRRRRQQAAAI